MTNTPSHPEAAPEQMRDFEDFEQVLTGGGLELPVRGTVYVVEPCSAENGIYLTRLFGDMERASRGISITTEGFTDEQESELMRRILGAAYDDMLEDGVPWPAVRHAMAAAWVYQVHGTESARAVWNSGGDPKALASARAEREREKENRQQRRARAAQERTSTGAASATPPPDSTSGTSSPPTSHPHGQSKNSRRRRRRR